MPMQDLQEFFEPWLDLPISGKQYRVYPVDVETGLYCQGIVSVAVQVKAGEEVSPDEVASLKLDDDQERDFNRRVLGVEGPDGEASAFAQMLADGIPWPYVQHAARTAFMWIVSDRDAAEQVWAGGGRPEAPRPATQDHKAPAKKKTSKKSAPRGSAGGRTPRKKPASAGSGSSSTGN